MFIGILVLIGIAALVLMMGFNSAYIPPKADANLVLQASGTVTETTSATALDLGAGFAPGGIGLPVSAGVKISAIDRTTGDETYTWQIEESDDNSTFTAAGLASAAKTATGVFSLGAFISKRYVRATATLGGTSPSVTYEAWLYPISPMVG